MAGSIRITINPAGIKELLNRAETRAMLTEKARHVLALAQEIAPVESGAYKASLRIEQGTTDRAVVAVIAGTDHAFVVEANTGTLRKALDAAR